MHADARQYICVYAYLSCLVSLEPGRLRHITPAPVQKTKKNGILTKKTGTALAGIWQAPDEVFKKLSLSPQAYADVC